MDYGRLPSAAVIFEALRLEGDTALTDSIEAAVCALNHVFDGKPRCCS